MPELNEIALLKQQGLRPGAKVFNVGAHQGVFALMMAKIVGSGGMVVAVEANWHNASVARENRDLNDAPQLVIVEAAAGRKSGTLLFSEELNGHVELGSGRWPVPCVSIDDLRLRYGAPDVLYMDVEGFEVEVLKGAANTLKHRPDCFVEVHVDCGLQTYGSSAESVVSFFRTANYNLFIAEQDAEVVRIDPFMPSNQAIACLMKILPGCDECAGLGGNLTKTMDSSAAYLQSRQTDKLQFRLGRKHYGDRIGARSITPISSRLRQ